MGSGCAGTVVSAGVMTAAAGWVAEIAGAESSPGADACGVSAGVGGGVIAAAAAVMAGAAAASEPSIAGGG